MKNFITLITLLSISSFVAAQVVEQVGPEAAAKPKPAAGACTKMKTLCYQDCTATADTNCQTAYTTCDNNFIGCSTPKTGFCYSILAVVNSMFDKQCKKTSGLSSVCPIADLMLSGLKEQACS